MLLSQGTVGLLLVRTCLPVVLVACSSHVPVVLSSYEHLSIVYLDLMVDRQSHAVTLDNPSGVLLLNVKRFLIKDFSNILQFPLLHLLRNLLIVIIVA